MNDFWKEMDIAVRCIKLMKDFLHEEENIREKMLEKGHSTGTIDYRIERIKYALGERETFPFIREYINTPSTMKGE